MTPPAAGATVTPGAMSALVYEAPRVMVMRAVPVPTPGPGETVVRVAYSGICGSELSGFLGTSSIRTPPLVFGHEVSGHVAAVGPGVAAQDDHELGAAVTVNPLVTCGRCRYCVVGKQQLCPHRLLLGASLPGSNAEYVVVPAASLLPVPTGLDLPHAATVEPAAFAVHAVELSRVSPASSALVVGAGAIGLLLLQVLEQWGVRQRFVVERNADRLALAVAAGCTPLHPDEGAVPDQVRAATDGYGVGVAFDAVGSPVTRRDCLASVEAGGTVVLVGLHTDATELALNAVVRSEITVTGAFAYSTRHFRTALAWLADGRLGLGDGVVVAPLEDGQGWYERLVEGDPAVKVLLMPGPDEGAR
jgi:2-desacetyl-2-hydroxyethyl bacteriochlorophyllide A dehydrogenase